MDTEDILTDTRDIVNADGWREFRDRVQRVFSAHPVIALGSHSEPGVSLGSWRFAFADLLNWADAVGYKDEAQGTRDLKNILGENCLINNNVIHQLARINALFMDLELASRGPVEHKPDANCNPHEKRKNEQNEGEEGGEIKEGTGRKSESQLKAHVLDLYKVFESARNRLWETSHDLVQHATAMTKSLDPSYESLTEREFDSDELRQFVASGECDAMGPVSGESQLGGFTDYETGNEQEFSTGEPQLTEPIDHEASNEQGPDTGKLQLAEPQLEESTDYDASDEQKLDSGESRLEEPMDHEASNEQVHDTGEPQLEEPMDHEASNEQGPDTGKPQLGVSADSEARNEQEPPADPEEFQEGEPTTSKCVSSGTRPSLHGLAQYLPYLSNQNLRAAFVARYWPNADVNLVGCAKCSHPFCQACPVFWSELYATT